MPQKRPIQLVPPVKNQVQDYAHGYTEGYSTTQIRLYEMQNRVYRGSVRVRVDGVIMDLTDITCGWTFGVKMPSGWLPKMIQPKLLS